MTVIDADLESFTKGWNAALERAALEMDVLGDQVNISQHELRGGDYMSDNHQADLAARSAECYYNAAKIVRHLRRTKETR